MLRNKMIITLLVCISLAFVLHAEGGGVGLTKKPHQVAISMPNVRPDYAEQYLCKALRLPANSDGQYIVGFNPHGDTGKVHHMLMYGCELPGVIWRDTPEFTWDCSEMHTSNGQEQQQTYQTGPVCGPGSQHILYGWALDAPALKLPDGVGFKVGGKNSDIKFLVLQVHYGHHHVFDRAPDLTDNSGLILDMKRDDVESGITKQAGVLLLASIGQVERGMSRHQIWCDIEDDIIIHPFRYRVHTHKLGTKVFGAKLRAGNKNNQVVQYAKPQDNVEIGLGDPQKPQMFYPVKENNITIGIGDSVYAYCEFNNNKGHIVNIGQTGDDEMCNFYLMYWTESPKLLSKNSCYGDNRRRFSALLDLWNS